MSLKPLKPSQHPVFQAQRKLLWSLLLFSALVVVGTIGFYVISRVGEGAAPRSLLNSLYFTIVILATVGMESPKSAMEQHFSIFLMLVGIFLAAAAVSNVVAFAIDGEFNKHFGRRKLQKQINAMKGHFIVVGFGRTGKSLCEHLMDHGKEFVLVEKNGEKIAEAEKQGIVLVHGDATDEKVLVAAGLKQAAGLATCLPHDPANVFVTLTARELMPDMEIVARSEDPATESKLRRAGATRTICPAKEGGKQLYEMLVKPPVVDLIQATRSEEENIDVCVFKVERLPKLIGKSIRDIHLASDTGMVVTALERNGKHEFLPTLDQVLEKTDKIYLIGPEGGSEKLVALYSV
jgi:voltage-gated potassium channel